MLRSRKSDIRTAPTTSRRPPATPPSRAGMRRIDRDTIAWLAPSLAFIFVAGLLGVTTKLALEELSWQQLMLWTTLVYVVIGTVLVASGVRISFGEGAGWGVVSGALAVCGLVMLFLALGPGEVSQVVPVTASYPVVTMVFAAVILGERITGRRLVATVLVVGGVIMLSLN